jgi:hypothetical protein
LVDLSPKVDFTGQGYIEIFSSKDSLREDIIFIRQQFLDWLIKLESAAKSLILRLNGKQFIFQLGDGCLFDVFEVVKDECLG